MHNGGYFALFRHDRYHLTIDGLEQNMRFDIWISNMNIPYIPIEESDVVLNFLNLLKTTDTSTHDDRLNLPIVVCFTMQKKFGGENWCCILADTNSFDYCIYHNGNYYNFVVDELEVVIYQPGLICSEDDKLFHGNGDEEKRKCVQIQSILDTTCAACIFQSKDIFQRSYHCKTCNIIDDIICQACATKCHKDHDTKYIKYSQRNCSCDLNQEGKCLAKESDHYE